MLTSTLLVATFATTPLEWSPVVGLIMILSNIAAIAFGKSTIKYQSVGPEIPGPNFFAGFSLPALLATTAFGHVLGAGVILGLHNLGRL